MKSKSIRRPTWHMEFKTQYFFGFFHSKTFGRLYLSSFNRRGHRRQVNLIRSLNINPHTGNLVPALPGGNVHARGDEQHQCKSRNYITKHEFACKAGFGLSGDAFVERIGKPSAWRSMETVHKFIVHGLLPFHCVIFRRHGSGSCRRSTRSNASGGRSRGCSTPRRI